MSAIRLRRLSQYRSGTLAPPQGPHRFRYLQNLRKIYRVRFSLLENRTAREWTSGRFRRPSIAPFFCTQAHRGRLDGQGEASRVVVNAKARKDYDEKPCFVRYLRVAGRLKRPMVFVNGPIEILKGFASSGHPCREGIPSDFRTMEFFPDPHVYEFQELGFQISRVPGRFSTECEPRPAAFKTDPSDAVPGSDTITDSGAKSRRRIAFRLPIGGRPVGRCLAWCSSRRCCSLMRPAFSSSAAHRPMCFARALMPGCGEGSMRSGSPINGFCRLA